VPNLPSRARTGFGDLCNDKEKSVYQYLSTFSSHCRLLSVGFSLVRGTRRTGIKVLFVAVEHEFRFVVWPCGYSAAIHATQTSAMLVRRDGLRATMLSHYVSDGPWCWLA